MCVASFEHLWHPLPRICTQLEAKPQASYAFTIPAANWTTIYMIFLTQKNNFKIMLDTSPAKG